jgi:hypothetical protein
MFFVRLGLVDAGGAGGCRMLLLMVQSQMEVQILWHVQVQCRVPTLPPPLPPPLVLQSRRAQRLGWWDASIAGSRPSCHSRRSGEEEESGL